MQLNVNGAQAIEVSDATFGGEFNETLVHQAVVAYMAGGRQGTKGQKSRSDVSGGGKRPWRQKGTGRSRQGSNRSPQWAGGGVAHGPQPRDHEVRVNKKMRKGALRSALSDALASDKLAVIRELDFDEPKTKRAAEVLDALEADGKVLLVLPAPSDSGAVEKSFRNLRGVRVSYARSLGVYEVLAADRVVFTQDAIDVVEGSTAGKRPGAESGAKERTAKAEAEADDAGAAGSGGGEGEEG